MQLTEQTIAEIQQMEQSGVEMQQLKLNSLKNEVK